MVTKKTKENIDDRYNYPPELDLRPPPPPVEGDETRCWGPCPPPAPEEEPQELEELEIT
jgi:hypothetical protein